MFGEDWGNHPSSTQHLAKKFSETRKVLWINSIGLRRPKLNINDSIRVISKLSKMIKREQCPKIEVPQNMSIFQAKALPFPGNSMARRINSFLLPNSINEFARKQGIEKPVLWISLPSAVDAVGTLNEKLSIYYCGDDFSSLAGVDHDAISRMEEELVGRVDLIFTASANLTKKFPSGKAHYLPHGVDYDLFHQKYERPFDLPTGKPIAGFYGSISDWIDVDLLEHTAKYLPDWNIVLIGEVKTNIQKLKKFENVIFLGRKNHIELPAYVQNWQVSLLPFKRNQQIEFCNPLKLREYLAVGRPIVSTDIPVVGEYKDHVYVCGNGDDFSHKILEASFDGAKSNNNIWRMFNNWEGIEALQLNQLGRKLSVKDESWSNRANEVLNKLSKTATTS